MAWTKRQIVENAFEEIGLAGYAFDLQPEQLQAALRRLDTMMATWNAQGIRIGYPLPSSPGTSDLDASTGVPDAAVEAIVGNLAVRIAPLFGKTVSPDTKASARRAYNALLRWASEIPEMDLDRMSIPAGAGSKYWRYDGDPYLLERAPPLDAGTDGKIELE
jgi:hypothetical protein